MALISSDVKTVVYDLQVEDYACLSGALVVCYDVREWPLARGSRC